MDVQFFGLKKYRMKALKNMFAALQTRFLIYKNEIKWVVLTQIFGFIGGIAGTKALTFFMGPAAYGELALGMTVAVILGQIFYGPLGQVVLRYYSIYKQDNKLGLLYKAVGRIVLWSGLSFTTVIVMTGLGADFFLDKNWFFIILYGGLFGILEGINNLLKTLHNAARKRKIVFILQLLIQWARPVGGITAVLLFHKSSQHALAGYCAAMLLILFIQSVFFNQIGLMLTGNDKSKSAKALYNSFLHYGYPFLFWGVFTGLQFTTDKWILSYFFSTREVGIYTVMYQAANLPLLIIGGILTQFIMPIFFEKANSQDKKVLYVLLKKMNLMVSGLVAVLLSVYFLFSEQIVSLISSKDFIYFHSYLPLLLLSLAVYFIGQNFVMLGMGMLKTKIYIYPKILSALTILGFGIIGVKFLGFKGIILSNLLSSIIYCTYILLINRRLLRSTNNVSF